MRVAIDATPLTLSSGGLARYTSELALALAAEFPEDDYALVSDQKFPLPHAAPSNLQHGSGPSNSLERRWWLYGVQRAMARLRTSVFHGTNFAVPYVPTRPSVMTLHDLSPWMDPRWHHGAGRVRRHTSTLIGLGVPTMIVTDSEAVRRQAIDWFRINPARIAAVPLAASSHFRPVPVVAPPRPFFLYVGTLEPRKNLPFLVNSWRPVYQTHGVELILAGRRRVDFGELPNEPGLRIVGETDEKDLPALYSQALAFVYPSSYEGFGLPVLEAMQCGACVIASTDAAIVEVAGKACVLLDPRDTRAWTETLRDCARGGDCIARSREDSLAQARQFSWRRTARLTREIYLEAVRRFDG